MAVLVQIRSKAKPMCIDSPADHHSYHKAVNMWPCHGQGGNQYWMLSKAGEIRRDDGCLDYSGGADVIIYPCHGQKGNQEWAYREVCVRLWVWTKGNQRCVLGCGCGQRVTRSLCWLWVWSEG